ncbi:MAG: amino acid ABC transporter substrate-binding protein [bacterium]|nr:amino acid ABC transporter substrate-binding protein [bacterium]
MKTRLRFTLATVLAAATMLSAPLAWAATVTFGGAISQTGRFAEPAGRVLNSYKMFVDELNARGGVLGRKVKLNILDDKSDKQTSIKLFEKLITVDKVEVVLAPYSSGITDAVANVTERYKMPMIASGAASTVIWKKGRKYIFNIIAVAENYQKGALYLAKEIGAKRIAIISADTLFPRMVANGAQEWAKKLGLKVVLAENYPRKQTDFTALLQKIKSRRAEVIISNSYFDDSAAQIRQLRELGINLKMFSGTVGPGLPKFAKQLGATAEYVVGFSQWEPVLKLGYPGMKVFIENYTKRYGVKPNYHAGQSYATMQVTEAALKKAGSFDGTKLRNALASIKVETMFGTYKVNSEGLNVHDGLTFQILNGERKIIWPSHVAEAKAQIPMPKWSDRPKN